MSPLPPKARDWRTGCECSRVGLCYRCQAAGEIESLQRQVATLSRELAQWVAEAQRAKDSAHEPPAVLDPGASMAIAVSRYIHNVCKDVPHDIGLRVMEIIGGELFERARPSQPQRALLADELKRHLLDEPWHERCEIILDYLPPRPPEGTQPYVVVRFDDGSGYPAYLRYSKGPKQGFFWDVYGEDMQSEALAIMALSRAPFPRSVSPLLFKVPASTPTKCEGQS